MSRFYIVKWMLAAMSRMSSRRFVLIASVGIVSSALETGAWAVDRRFPTSPTTTRSARVALSHQHRFRSSSSRIPRSSSNNNKSEVTTRSDVDVLGGVDEFEAWFAALPGAFCHPSVQHRVFGGGSLRGLAYTAEDASTPNSIVGRGLTTVVRVPRDVILSAPYSDPDWDVSLAQQLWKECRKGRTSSIYGYCALLTRGISPSPDNQNDPSSSSSSSFCPPSTAPNALRHWSTSQKQLLEASTVGKNLLAAQRAQDEQWRTLKWEKFVSSSHDSHMTWEQCQWALEAVRSRAFRGDLMNRSSRRGRGPLVVSLLAPLVSALVGYLYLQSHPIASASDNAILLSLALVGASPTVLQVLQGPQEQQQQQEGDAVLLPLVDSANHSNHADSHIEYDPLGRIMSLSISPACLQEDKDGEEQKDSAESAFSPTTQLYVSYGDRKTDAEWLLNYGFLPGVTFRGKMTEDEQRRRLAEVFLARNASQVG